MKTVKRILLGVAALIVLVLVVAMFVPGDYTVERSTEVKRSKNDVFNYVSHIRNQEHFSVWNMADPNIELKYSGEDGKVGFITAWDSKIDEVGKGEQEIVKINEGQSVETTLRFYRPWEGIASTSFTTEQSTPDMTKVKWTFRGKMPYPMNLMLIFSSPDAFLGKDLQQSLDNLKKNLETSEGVAQQ
jgi:hypothetical protein